MKKLFSVLCLMALSFAAFAQKPVISFETESHDFGEIQEKEGPVTYIFKYNNTGATPLVVSQVTASCGCTTPEWTQTPIKAGGAGEIKVTFDPANRPGTFNKSITVRSNADQAVKTLRISGKVLQRPKTLEDEYPVVMDGLRLTDNSLPFTKVRPNETKTAEIKVVNTSDAPLTPEFINVPQHIKIACQPATVKPGEKGVIVATYDASLKNDWGFVSDRFYIIFDGKKQYKNSIMASATIEEDFSKVDAKDAPVLSVSEKSYDFGDIPQTEKVSHDFIITNNGNSNLIIRKVKASCGCTAVKPEKTVLAKGESTPIHVTFDPRGKNGRQNKNVTVITNDPQNSNILLRISSNVIVPGQNADGTSVMK